jgi:hypothetical protein
MSPIISGGNVVAGARSRVLTANLGSPAVGADNAVLADTEMDDTEPTVVTEGITNPAVPRNLTVKGNDANVSGDVVIAGTNAGGEAITETIALSGASVVAGDKAFATVTSITLPPYDTADTERVRVGTGAKLGMPDKLTRDTVVNAYLNGVREVTRPTVAFSAAALESNTVTLNSALNGNPVAVDYYRG